MSKQEKTYWVMEVTMDHAARTYTVVQVLECGAYMSGFEYYVMVEAYDEIGTYHEAQKVLSRLGFTLGA